MKVEVSTKKDFEPIDLKITIESKNELMFILQFFGSMSQANAIESANKSMINDKIHFDRHNSPHFGSSVYRQLINFL